MMIDKKRLNKLEEAKKLIFSASLEEKEELFKDLIEQLKEKEDRFNKPDNRFDTHEHNAYMAMDHLRIFVRGMIGYNVGWIPEKFLEHCANNAGRKTKYDGDTREVNCIFISLMVERGAPETQAMKLLMRLRGDDAMTSGHLRELQDSYRDYKSIKKEYYHENIIVAESWAIADFLGFSISNLEGEEKASTKAVNAFVSLWQEIIDLMKKYHPIIAEYDKSYPDIFGCAIDWVNSEYENPLDYFYNQESHKKFPLPQRETFLREYLNTVGFFSKNMH